MATAQILIDRSMRLLDQLNSGESGTAQESADALIALNSMIDSWLADRDFGIVTLTTYATLSTSQSLPYGYDDAIVYNLAVRLAAEYKVPPPPEVAALAASTFALIRRAAAPAITATVQKIVNRALRMIGQIGPDEISTATESNYAFDTLNAMLSTWRNERLMCYAIQDQTITLSSGNATRTVGPTGNLVTTRPVKIDAAYIIYSGVSIPVKMLTDEEWAYLPDKTSTSTYPDRMYYREEFPDGKVYVYPVPNASSDLHILTWTPVLAFASLGTTVSLPPGWDDALAPNLAVYLAAEYPNRKLSPVIVELAKTTKAAIKKINSRPIKAYTELKVLLGKPYANIERGW